jgi:ornithine cyclodeaminase/alanine dehydrogenase-like protein (mu-crystallin family)
MALTILSDETIQSLLSSLNREETFKVLDSLARALSEYSANSSKAGYASRYQPQRAGITAPDGQLTLFMPFTSATSVGTKVVGLAPSSGAGSGAKNTAPKGVVTLLDAGGNATGLLNAEELTAFRTSLSSMILYKDRKQTGKIVVFGAGKQALWHIRLALLLRGPEIEKITIVNRSTSRSDELLKTLEGDDQAKWRSKVEFEALDPLLFGYWQCLEERLADANVVFCCTPSPRPLFPARYLVSEEKLKKGCYVTAIGSHSASMAEIDPAIFTTVVNSTSGFAFHPTGGKGGAIVVDGRKSCLLEAGEIIQGKIGAESLVDVGEIVALEGNEKEKAKEWLDSGFVVYKCVGIAVMDAAVASELIDLARSKGVGVSIPDF